MTIRVNAPQGWKRRARRGIAPALLFFDAARRTRQTGAMDAIRHDFLAQLAEQEAEAARHLGDGYWTDGRTGRNVGLDELQAIGAMKAIALDPRPGEKMRTSIWAACSPISTMSRTAFARPRRSRRLWHRDDRHRRAPACRVRR